MSGNSVAAWLGSGEGSSQLADNCLLVVFLHAWREGDGRRFYTQLSSHKGIEVHHEALLF